MSEENKGREFWIIERCWPNKNSVFDVRPSEGSPCWRRKAETVHHVISYAAFEQCQAENEKLKKQLAAAVGALKSICDNRCAEQNPCESKDALKQIEEMGSKNGR